MAFNPAALTTNLVDLVSGGILVINKDAFDEKGLKQAGYEENPLDDGSLAAYQVFPVEVTRLTRLAVEGLGLGTKESDRCRNFYAMGLVFWLYDRSLDPTLHYIEAKFGKRPEIAEANRRALKAGYNYGETTEAFASQFRVNKAELNPGLYRNIMGNEATAYGLITAAKRSNCELFLGSYPITPASDILHELAKHKNFGVRTFQAEDEIAAVTSAIGASFGGAMAVTASSGPGIALKARGDRPGRNDRAAAVDHQRAARRAEHRPADQDRAGRPAASNLRPQRRMPGAGHGGPQPGRLFRRGAWRPGGSPCVT